MEDVDDILQKDEAVKPPEVPGFLRDVDLEKFKPSWGTMRKGFSLPQYTLSFNDVPFAPLDGIHAITGQSGHGKTMTFSIFMAAILNGEYMGLSWNLPDVEPKVLYVDTEMEERNTMMVIARVHTMTDFSLTDDREDFRWLNLREVEKAEDRWSYVVAAMEEFHPTVVFLDGNLDLINDFNDNQQCQEHIRRCMNAASYYGISVWCLVHENPGSTKMVGHLGSMLERKVTDIFEARKVKDKESIMPVFEVEAKKTRGRDVPVMRFIVRQDASSLGIPELTDGLVMANTEKDEDSGVKMTVQEAILKVFAVKQAYNTRNLRDAISRFLKIRAVDATSYISEAVSSGLIKKSVAPDGNGYIYTRVDDGENLFTNTDADTPNETPF